MKVQREHILKPSLSASPVTPKGQIVTSRLEVESDPFNPMDKYTVTYTPDAEEAIKVLQFLDEMNGISWTAELARIERELREALRDLMGSA